MMTNKVRRRKKRRQCAKEDGGGRSKRSNLLRSSSAVSSNNVAGAGAGAGSASDAPQAHRGKRSKRMKRAAANEALLAAEGLGSERVEKKRKVEARRQRNIGWSPSGRFYTIFVLSQYSKVIKPSSTSTAVLYISYLK
jgi:hypothetical protein